LVLHFEDGERGRETARDSLMDKTINEATQILQKISNGQRTQRDWQRRCREEQNDKSKPKVLVEFSEKMNQRSRKMNRPYKKLKIHFPR
jgi:hypothetical protein